MYEPANSDDERSIDISTIQTLCWIEQRHLWRWKLATGYFNQRFPAAHTTAKAWKPCLRVRLRIERRIAENKRSVG